MLNFFMLGSGRGSIKSISRFWGTSLNTFGGLGSVWACNSPSATRPRAQTGRSSWRKPGLRAKVFGLAPIICLICL